MRPSRRAGWGQEAHSEVWKGTGGPPKGPESPPGGLGGVERPTWRAGSPTQRSKRGWESHAEVWEGSGGTPGGPGCPREGLGGVGRPTQRSGRGR